MKLNPLIIMSLVLLTVSCNTPNAQTENTLPAAKTDTIPFTMVDTFPTNVAPTPKNLGSFNCIILEVGVNDTVIKMLLDCGFPYTNFNRNVLEQIHQPFTVFDKKRELSTTDMTLLLSHSPLHLDTIYADTKFEWDSYCDAILGYELFDRHIVEIDFEHRNIILHDVLPEKVSSYKPYDLHRTPEDPKLGMLPRVIFDGFVKKDGTKTDAWLLVDLGAMVSVWNKDFRMQLTTDSLKLDPNSQAYDLFKKTNQLNDYFFPVTDNHNVKQDGCIGVDYLSQHNVIFDYPHNKLYLKPNGE